MSNLEEFFEELENDDEVEHDYSDDFDEPIYYEDSDWEERTERYWFPGPK